MRQPPFTLTETILNTSVAIAEKLGTLTVLRQERPPIQLRKENKIKTIHSSLAIEGNTLSLQAVTDIIDGTPVIGVKQEIQEVKNAINVYDAIAQYNYQSLNAFKKAHQLMMKDLIKDAGSLRTGNVGIFAGSQISHVAPPAKRVPQLIDDLFQYVKAKTNYSLLIKACIFHYELEFIHPFSDGNGRMGRLWQQVILMQYHPVFEYLPIESFIKANQQEYYQVLSQCDQKGNSTLFIEFGLAIIDKALAEYAAAVQYVPRTKIDRLTFAAKHFKKEWFSRQAYMKLHRTVSTATASRDLSYGVKQSLLRVEGSQRLAKYQFKQ